MRWLSIFVVVAALVPKAPAQTQEHSLIDRLLRPNMELRNNAQNKKFSDTATVVERRGKVDTFYMQPNRAEKSFTDSPHYSTAEYTSAAFNSASRTNIAAETRRPSTSPPSIATSSIRDVRAANDVSNRIAGRDYAEQQRQFTERGKSQKSLDRKNPPLTIDQVRELLNKNK